MKKNFVLDTNVLLHDPRSIFGFDDNDVVIPIYVIEEIDNFKRDLSTLGRNARQVSRYLDEFRLQGKLADGVAIAPDKGRIRVLLGEKRLPHGAGEGHATDDKILGVALELREREKAIPTVFVTKDTNLRIRADALGLHSEDYDVEGLEALDDLWSGVSDIEVGPEQVNDFYANGSIPWTGGEPPPPNAFVVLRDRANPQHSAVGKYSAARQTFVKLIQTPKEGVWGIRPRNKEQSFALDLLLNDEIRLVTIVGKAGTGKTLLAIAAGLEHADQVHQPVIAGMCRVTAFGLRERSVLAVVVVQSAKFQPKLFGGSNQRRDGVQLRLFHTSPVHSRIDVDEYAGRLRRAIHGAPRGSQRADGCAGLHFVAAVAAALSYLYLLLAGAVRRPRVGPRRLRRPAPGSSRTSARRRRAPSTA